MAAPGSATSKPGASPGGGRRSLAAAIGCISVVGITLGFTWPLLSLILESRGVASTTIGLNAAMTPLAMVLVPRAMPWLFARLGTLGTIVAALSICVAVLLLLPIFDHLAAWYPLRFALGIGVGILFVVSEAWINQISPDDRRGRVMGIYGAVLAAGFATGPVLIRFTGIEGTLPFIVAAAVTAAAALPPLLFGRDAPTLAGRPGGGLRHFLRAAPTAMAGVFLFGFLEGAWGSFLPLYGVRGGLEVEVAALLLSALLAGAIVLQYPIGWLADRMDRRRLLIFCAAAAALGGAGLPVAFAAGAVLWLWLFLTGGLAEGIYTASLTVVGERFRGPDLAAASAALVMMYSMGSLVGPPVAGAAMDVWDPHGLPLILTAAGALYVGFELWRARRRP